MNFNPRQWRDKLIRNFSTRAEAAANQAMALVVLLASRATAQVVGSVCKRMNKRGFDATMYELPFIVRDSCERVPISIERMSACNPSARDLAAL